MSDANYLCAHVSLFASAGRVLIRAKAEMETLAKAGAGIAEPETAPGGRKSQRRREQRRGLRGQRRGLIVPPERSATPGPVAEIETRMRMIPLRTLEPAEARMLQKKRTRAEIPPKMVQ